MEGAEIIYKHIFSNGSIEYRDEKNAHEGDVAYVRVRLINDKMIREYRLEEALERIKSWANAYPVGAFPPPTKADFEKADKVLRENDLSLGAIGADCMRRIFDGIRRIANEALK